MDFMNRESFEFEEDGAEEREARVLSRRALREDDEDIQFRPLRWDEYFGQDKVKANLKIAIDAAMARGDALDHVLLYGPPGLGKTTLAGIIAHEMHADMRITSGPAIERQGDLAAILTNLNEHDVLFIDEIHRLNRQVEEILYPAMEDYALDIMIGKGPSARSIRLDLPKFTLIGATTRAGLLTSPLRDRFGLIQRLDLYRPEDIASILSRYAGLLGVGIDKDGLEILSTRCRGTPRVAIRLLRRMRDYAQIIGDNVINRDICTVGLKALEVDEIGLDANDRLIMRVIAEMYDGGPVGLDTLAASTGEDRVTIEDIYEPYLMQIGFIVKTPRGRMLTRGGYEHLGLPYKPSENRQNIPDAQISLDDVLNKRSDD